MECSRLPHFLMQPAHAGSEALNGGWQIIQEYGLGGPSLWSSGTLERVGHGLGKGLRRESPGRPCKYVCLGRQWVQGQRCCFVSLFPSCHLHLPSPLFSWRPQTSWSGRGHSCLPVCHLYETAIQQHSPNPILASEELSSNDLILINLNLIAHGSLTEF